MPAKRKGNNLGRHTKKNALMKKIRSQRTDEQILQNNADKRVRMAQIRESQSQEAQYERNQQRRLKKQTRRFGMKRTLEEESTHPDHYFNLPQPLEYYNLSKIFGDIAIPPEPEISTKRCWVRLADFVKVEPRLYKSFTAQQLKRSIFLVARDGTICPKNGDNLDQANDSSDPILPDISLHPNLQPDSIASRESELPLAKEPDVVAFVERIKETPRPLPKALTSSQAPSVDSKLANKERKREAALEIIKSSFYDIWERVERLMSESERTLKKSRFHYSKTCKYLAVLGYDLSKQYELSFQSRLNLSKTTRLNVNYVYRKVKQLNRAHTIKKRHRCKQCSFTTESLLVYDDHLRKPHLVRENILDEDTITLISTYTLRCPYCNYRNRKSHVMRDHLERSHCISTLFVPSFEAPPRFYSCILCLYEVDKEVNLVHHMEKCRARYDPKCFLSLSRMYTSYFPFTYDNSIPRNAATLCYTESSVQPAPVFSTTTPLFNSSLGLNYNRKGPPNTTPYQAFTSFKPPPSINCNSQGQPLTLKFGPQTTTGQFTTADLFKQSPLSRGSIKPAEQQDSRNLLHKYMSMLKTLNPPLTSPSSVSPAQATVKELANVNAVNLPGEGGQQIRSTPFGVNISGVKSKYQVLVHTSKQLTDPQKKGIIETLITTLNCKPTSIGATPNPNTAVCTDVTPIAKTISSAGNSSSVNNSSLESLTSLISTLGGGTPKGSLTTTINPLSIINNYRSNRLNGLLDSYVEHRKSLSNANPLKSQSSRLATLAEIVNRADSGNKTLSKTSDHPVRNQLEHIDLDSSSYSDEGSLIHGTKRKGSTSDRPIGASKKKRTSSPESDGEISILGEYKNSNLPKSSTDNYKGTPESISSSRSVEGKSTKLDAGTGPNAKLTCEICDVSYDAILDAHVSHNHGDRNDQAIIDHYETVHDVRICPKNQNKISTVGRRGSKCTQSNLPIPPLSCRRCLTRYYTLNGLERHLAASHDVILPDIAGIMARSGNRPGSGTGPKFCIWCSSQDNLILFKDERQRASAGIGGGGGVDMIAHLSQTHGIDLRIRGSPTYACTLCTATDGSNSSTVVAFECYETLMKHAARAHGVTLSPHSDSALSHSGHVAFDHNQTSTNLTTSADSCLNDGVGVVKTVIPSTPSFPCTFCQSPNPTNNSTSTEHYYPNAGAFILHMLTDHAALLTPGITKRIMESSSGKQASKPKPPVDPEDGANIFLNHIPDTIYTLYNQCALAANALKATIPTNGPTGVGQPQFTLDQQHFAHLFNADGQNCEAGLDCNGQFNEQCKRRDYLSSSSAAPSSNSYHTNRLPALKPIYSSPTKQSHLYCV